MRKTKLENFIVNGKQWEQRVHGFKKIYKQANQVSHKNISNRNDQKYQERHRVENEWTVQETLKAIQK